MWRAILGHLKLGYLYLLYWLVGLDEEGFYVMIGLHDKAVEHLSHAYSRRAMPEFGTALARALLEAGDPDRSQHLHAVLMQSADSYSSELREELIKLGEALSTSAAHVGEALQEARKDA